ncbi:MAG: hypothetical protein ABIY55_10540 [Kofleriaceae bacterium]
MMSFYNLAVRMRRGSENVLVDIAVVSTHIATTTTTSVPHVSHLGACHGRPSAATTGVLQK